MKNVKDPWITTTERIPYLVFPVGLPSNLAASDVRKALTEKVPNFADIYNCTAFSLSDENDLIFCMRKFAGRDECAIIALVNKPIALNQSERSEDPICGQAFRGLKLLNRLLDREASPDLELKILRVDPQEISQKTPN